MAGVYSTAPEAATKKKLDDQIKAAGGTVEVTNEAYLKELIKLASNGKVTVGTKSKGLQFFIVRGGAEGFLPPSYSGTDASRRTVVSGSTTSGRTPSAPTTMIFDDNDLLTAFDVKGNWISSALLSRPLKITNPNIWSEPTANAVYEAWDGGAVSLYYNKNFYVKYYGLQINDSKGYYKSGRVRVDLHKKEATNGCIFILDPNTPTDFSSLSGFEPEFIKDIQTAIKAEAKQNIGTMRMVKLK